MLLIVVYSKWNDLFYIKSMLVIKIELIGLKSGKFATVRYGNVNHKFNQFYRFIILYQLIKKIYNEYLKVDKIRGFQIYVEMRFEYCFIKYLTEWSACVFVYVALEILYRFWVQIYGLMGKMSIHIKLPTFVPTLCRKII